jgi:hypothetical protein
MSFSLCGFCRHTMRLVQFRLTVKRTTKEGTPGPPAAASGAGRTGTAAIG